VEWHRLKSNVRAWTVHLEPVRDDLLLLVGLHAIPRHPGLAALALASNPPRCSSPCHAAPLIAQDVFLVVLWHFVDAVWLVVFLGRVRRKTWSMIVLPDTISFGSCAHRLAQSSRRWRDGFSFAGLVTIQSVAVVGS